MTLKLGLTLLAVSLLATGCGHAVKRSTVVIAPPVHPLDELRSIGVEARDELRLLAKIKDAKNAPSLTVEQHAQKHFQATHVPAGFERTAQFSYTGDATRAAEALAQVAGYKFRTLGKPMPNEPWVTIHIRGLPLAEALRELGVQTGSAIRVEIHEAERLMVVVYRG